MESLLDQVREVLNRGNLSTTQVDRLLEEGFSSTDIAASLFVLLGGPAEARPAAENPAATAAVAKKPKPPQTSEPQPALRPPARGMQWVRLSVGRESRVTPRDIVSLLEDSLGLPARSVGIIDISIGQSFAQVADQYLDVIKHESRRIEIQDGYVEISLIPVERKEFAPKKHGASGKFHKKEYRKKQY